MPRVSSSDKIKALTNLSYQFNLLGDEINLMPDKIGKSCAEEFEHKIISNYDTFKNSVNDNQDRSDFNVTTYNHGKGIYEIVVSGKQVLYDEFGTGTRGEKYADGEVLSQKSKYGMDPYNSGPYVSENIDKNGNHYWYYNHRINYGVKPGMFVYDAQMDMIDSEVNKISKSMVASITKKIFKL